MRNFTRLAHKTQKLLSEYHHWLPFFNDCLLCHYSTSSQQLICQTCLQDLDNFPLGYDLLFDNPKASADISHENIDGITLVATYQWPFSTALPQLKFHQSIQHAKWLGQLLSEQLEHLAWRNIDCICPVPLHRERLASRGFNQAELLCRFLSVTQPIKHLLIRRKSTQAQTRLTRRDRLNNLKNAFYCPHDLTGKSIVLIDDVITTGTTVNEAAKELKRQGATAVFVAAVAIRLKT